MVHSKRDSISRVCRRQGAVISRVRWRWTRICRTISFGQPAFLRRTRPRRPPPATERPNPGLAPRRTGAPGIGALKARETGRGKREGGDGDFVAEVEGALGLPVVVKPSKRGSTVGL